MKNAVKKYKKNITKTIEQPEVSQLTPLLSPVSVKKVSRGSLEKGKIQKRQYTKKKKVSADIDDIYAVGLGINNK